MEKTITLKNGVMVSYSVTQKEKPVYVVLDRQLREDYPELAVLEVTKEITNVTTTY